MGKVMALVDHQIAGRADMGEVSKLVKAMLAARDRAHARVIPESFIQELLARVDIVDVVERYVQLKKAGANYQACCPFHSEKSPSFTVSPSKQFYHCFGCRAHGSAISFVMQYAGLLSRRWRSCAQSLRHASTA